MRGASAASLFLLALLALPSSAAEPIRLDFSIRAPLAAEVRPVERPVVPENLTLPPGLQTPGAALNPGEIPALPPAALLQVPQAALETLPGEFGTAPQGPEAQIRERAGGPTVLSSLQGIAEAKGGAELAPRYFDRKYLPPVSSFYSGDGAAPSDEGPKRPRGVSGVDVNIVHGPADILRHIPDGVNSDGLKAKLVEHVDTMAPYTIYTYHDSRGGRFVGIDLSRNPKLIDVLPEQQSHEVKLIKKIQVWNQDLQVLVRETGKTPDLIVGGVVTELKSLIGDKVDFTYLVNKANNQVHEHAERHRLGNGAVVVDLAAETAFTPKLAGKLAHDLELWRKMPVGYEIPGFYTGPRIKKQPIALDKVYVFAGSDLRMFVRHQDGSYRLAEPSETSFGIEGRMPGFKKHQLFLRRPGLARPPPPDTQLGHAFDQMFLIKEIRTMVEKGRVKRAFEIWQEFELQNTADTVRRVKNQIRDIWPDIVRGRKGRRDEGGGRRR